MNLFNTPGRFVTPVREVRPYMGPSPEVTFNQHPRLLGFMNVFLRRMVLCSHNCQHNMHFFCTIQVKARSDDLNSSQLTFLFLCAGAIALWATAIMSPSTALFMAPIGCLFSLGLVTTGFLVALFIDPRYGSPPPPHTFLLLVLVSRHHTVLTGPSQ